jgi:outer membrane protein, heavy metal efflux system
MNRFIAVAMAVASSATIAQAQTAGGSATAPIAQPATAPSTLAQSTIAGPPSPGAPLAPRTGPLPQTLTLEQALEEAAARSPTVVAAQADVDASRGRLRQAGFRANPQLSVDVENFTGSGAYSGLNSVETTVTLNQQLDLFGRRSARVNVAQAALAAQELRLAIARADLVQAVRTQFAGAVAARDRLQLARDNAERARELARIADELVAAGREPPLRALRARANFAQTEAALRAAEAADLTARRLLAGLFGMTGEVGAVTGPLAPVALGEIEARATLEVRLAEADRLQAEAALRQEQIARRLNPSVGIGLRRLQQTSDTALVAGVSVPLPLFDRNQGNIAAAGSAIRAAEARRDAALALATARIRNAQTNLDAARARVDALEGAALPQAAEALRLANLAYRAGRLTLLELLDAQQALAAAQGELIDARVALAEASATLVRAAAQ